MTAKELAKEYIELQKAFGELRAEMASKRSIEDIVKYLLYFWLSLSVALGLLGWKQISDIDQSISNEVGKQLPRDSDMYRKYGSLIAETKKLKEDFDKLTLEYRERVEDLKYADVVAGDFDLEGQINTILKEIQIPGRDSDSKWRAKAITVLEKLKSSVGQRSFPADYVFNAAQMCRKLNQFQLAEELTKAAFEKDQSPPIKALKLSSEVANMPSGDRSRSFTELMQMVATLNSDASPQIVLAEAWNAAEHERNYTPLLEAIELRAKSNTLQEPPSYMYAIKAQALLRRSRPGDKLEAQFALEKGREIFVQESPLSQWSESFSREYKGLLASIEGDRSVELDSRVDEQIDPAAMEELLKSLMIRPDQSQDGT